MGARKVCITSLYRSAYLLGIFSLWSYTSCLAQSDADLADAYFQKGECDKVVTLYQKVLRKDFNKIYLRRYVNCMIKLKNFEEAEKFFKRQQKADEKFGYLYTLYWGRMLEQMGQVPAATLKYQESIAQAPPKDINAYKDLSEEFREIDNTEAAINALLKGRDMAGNDNLFKMELAALYAQTGKTEQMIEELLSLGVVIQSKEVIQNYFQDFLREEKDQAKFEKILYEKIQRQPNETFYAEMLIWFLTQKKQFSKAFIQERALDRRLKYNGAKIFDLGNLALQNKDYGASIQSFEYIIKEYPQGQLYPYARRMVIVAREEQVKNTFPIEQAAVRKLIEDYKKLLGELGQNNRTLDAMRSMANLYAFYLNEKDTATVILQNAIKIGRAESDFIDKCKLDLGDIFLLKNEPWESTLLYSQVEKSQKETPLGYEAKLRNARLNYYKGDFALAKDILDILKMATSREIANDAGSLSLLIQDNTGLDTSEAAMREYAAIDLLLYQNQTTEALAALDELFKKYKDHSLADEILWLKARTYAKMGDHQKAVDNLQQIVEKFSADILADDALFMMAELYQNRFKDKEKAMELYQTILEKHPASIYGAEARKQFRLLRGDSL
ncbi:tetratricopeptide repeat protein [Runella sp. MFBS21]|uniref:tetratricopeptide repeat protein n=1 Tax=Runella sp. MFBS21 TaxID=3034018 RepID=UPI0023F7D273|nr:tetratricopeptide repeat protein [Runella sp. MFBS21]MDF7821701.1 tetratricopeptide repeat protein [Runella sp. MFBS21]